MSVRGIFWGTFFFFSLVLYILGAFLLKTVIPLAVVGYEMIIANWVLRAASLVFTISCPTCARLWNIFSYFVFENRTRLWPNSQILLSFYPSQLQADLTAVETAFSDLHRRYEKLKEVVENFKKVMPASF